MAIEKAIAASTAGTVNPRRSCSRVEKRRIVDEAFRPGASVADVARHHGLNANQVFNWRREIQARSSSAARVGASTGADPSDPASIIEFAELMPVGFVVRADGRPALMASSPTVSAMLEGSTPAHAAKRKWAGVIEIELACGTR